jgi:hypothetical protein
LAEKPFRFAEKGADLKKPSLLMVKHWFFAMNSPETESKKVDTELKGGLVDCCLNNCFLNGYK